MNHTTLIALSITFALALNGLAIWALRRWRRSHRAQAARKAPWWSALQARKGLTFAFTLLIAAIPSVLVVRDRWFGDWRTSAIEGSAWCDLGLFCEALGPMPVYIILIVPCMGATFLLVGRQSHHFMPWLTGSAWRNHPDRQSPAVGSRQKKVGGALLALAGVGVWANLALAVIFGRLPQWTYALSILALLAGLFLRENSLGWLEHTWITNKSWVTAALWVHLALVAYLAELYGTQRSPWLSAVLLALALLYAMRHRRDIPHIFWVVSIALVLYAYGVNAWWFSIVGDEYEFFRFARLIATEYRLSDIASRLFRGEGVYGINPFLSSLIQAFSIRLFGVSNFGWRFSNLYLMGLAVGFFYAFLRSFTRRTIALLGAGFLSVSHYLITFGKIGYNNPQALLALAFALWVAATAIQTSGVFWFAFLGVALGGCLYVYPIAIFSIPIVVLLVWVYRKQTRIAVEHWTWMGLGAGLLMFPLLLQPHYWSSKLPGVFLSNPDISRSVWALLSHLATNAFYASMAFVVIPEETHFVAVSLVDPISGVFILIGLAWLIHNARGNRFGVFALASYVIVVALAGIIHGYSYPPVTRMFFLLPWYALLAAMGLLWAKRRVEESSLPAGMPRVIVPTLLVAIIAANLFQAYSLSRERIPRYQSIQMLFLRLAEKTFSAPDGDARTIVVLNDAEHLDMDLMWDMMQLYRVPVRPDQIREVVPTGPELDEEVQAVIQERNTLVILHPALPKDWQLSLAASLQEVGKQQCDVQNTRGVPRFAVWYESEFNSPCESVPQ